MYNQMLPYQPNYIPTCAQRQDIIRVNGENGAKSYQMAPNSSVLLLDETAPIIWLKSTDGASYPTLTAYKIERLEEHVEPSNDILSLLEERITKLEKKVNNGKQSNISESTKDK